VAYKKGENLPTYYVQCWNKKEYLSMLISINSQQQNLKVNTEVTVMGKYMGPKE